MEVVMNRLKRVSEEEMALGEGYNIVIIRFCSSFHSSLMILMQVEWMLRN